MPRWLPRVLARIHRLAAEGKVQLTEKAFEELRALPLGISIDEWLYVFKPRIAEIVLYVKLVLRADCVVISFHEEGGDDDQDQGEG